MDKRPDPLKQVKEKENKIFQQKAETISKELKEMTGTPSIDPLSRKMAELITQRELASLGIQPTEIPPKKPFITYPEDQGQAAKSKIHDATKNRQENKPDEPAAGHFSESKKAKRASASRDSKKSDFKPEKNEEKSEKNLQKDEMINNIEHIKALQMELQNEYPELDLKDDEEGQSVHTNELNELVEECKILSPDKNPKDLLEVASPGSELRITEASPVTERLKTETISEQEKSQDAKTFIKNRLVKQDSPSKIEHIPQHSSMTDKKNAELFDLCSSLLKGKSEAMTSKTPDILKRQALKQLESAAKAEFLHLADKPVGQYTPRCHINLNSLKSSPIFLSFRVPKDSKMKAEQGFASVDSLRVLLLKKLLEPEPVEKDMYTKNLEWVQAKEERLQEIREKNKGKETEGCTFDPYFEKHEALKVKEEPLVYKAVLRNDLDNERKEYIPVIPENILVYEALSPVCNQVRYVHGFNFEKLQETGKVLVSYQSINQFK